MTSLPGTGIWFLASVLVTSSQESWRFTGDNVALNKAAEQGPYTYYIHYAHRAIDGNTDTSASNGHCSVTTRVYNTAAYWSVNLVSMYILKGIRLYNQNNYRERLGNFQVIGYPSGVVFHDDRTASPQLYNNLVIDIPVYSATAFSSVTVWSPAHGGWPENGYSQVTLCEVEIYSSSGETVNGDWTAWSDWTSCSVTCGSGLITRTRTCTNPAPQNGGADCSGYSTDNLSCELGNCPIDGGWTDWFSLTSCSVTCGSGWYTRTRTCTKPAPQYNGVGCSGEAKETIACNIGNCPIDGGWTEWSAWTACSVTCGMGEITRTRTCTNPASQNGGAECLGDVTDYIACDRGNCPSEYTPLSSEGTTDKSSVAPLAAGASVGGVFIAAVVGIVFFVVYRRRRRRGDPYSVPDTTYENHVCYSDLQNELNEKEGNKVEKKVKAQKEDKKEEKRFKDQKEDTNVKKQREEKNKEKKVEELNEDKKEEKKIEVQNEEKKEEKKVKAQKEEKKQEKNEEKKIKEQKDENKEETNVLEQNEEKREEKMSVVVQEEIIHEEKGDTYYSFAEKSELPETAIKVEDLPDVVFGGDVSSKRFSTEFRAFPEGMTKAHEKALVNRNKNRYKHIYAYDETRVVLDIWDEGKDTDYINACYIHGFTKPKAYIASQGVTLENMEDFWRMVWQANSKTIVMLTKLYEEDKVKCLQYWPNEESVTHGHITVTLESTEPFCNFIIRTLLVEKSGESQRRVKHFHFTTWPDRDVPAFCSSFVHFRNKVKAATSLLDGPVIVHCSAGIGRTGTFIAIDYLTDQGKEMGYVDAVRCVETLRRQRVEMVQKEKQYVFIHQVLVEILLLKTSVVSTSEFAESYQDLLEHENGKRKLDEQFELLQKLSPKTDEQIAGKNVQYMPSLSGPGRTRDNVYINATFLPMYREEDAMIITQTPLETNKEDFWKLVYHQQVHTVVMMDHIPQLEDTAIYWPDAGDTDTVGDITVSNKSVDEIKGHSVLQLTVSIEGEEHRVQLIQFCTWDDDEPLPDSSTHILTCLELVEDNQRKFGNKPIVVHCMDGVERSGLFCVIAALLDRTKIEQDVAISQVIQELRNRTGHVVPSVEQFQFCHEVVLEFLQQFQTYSNFSSSVRSRECSEKET